MRLSLMVIGAAAWIALIGATPPALAGAAPPAQAPAALTPAAAAADSSDEAAWAEADRRYRSSYYYAAYLAADLQGHHDEALVLLQRASDADPKSVLLLRELAEQLELREHEPEAAEALKKALSLQPGDDELRQKLARFFIRSGKNDEARSLFMGPDGGEPQDKAPLRALAALDMAEDKWGDAEKRLARLVQLFPDAKDEREMYASVLARQGKDAEAAQQYLAVLQQEPGRAEAAYRLAHLYESMGRSGDAIAALKSAIAVSPDSALLKDALARTYYRLGKFAEAEDGFSQLLQDNTQDTESLLFRGMARLQGKKYRDAQADFLKLGEMDAGNPSQLYGLGLAQLWQGHEGEAEATFKKMIAEHPKAVPGYTQLAFIYDKTSRTAEAAALLTQGVKENPEAPELYLLLGSAQLDLGQMGGAEKTFVSGIKATGNSTALRFQLALLYDKAGKFPDAEKQLSEIIEIEPTNAQALNYLGYSWVDRGEKLQEGEDLIRRALKVEPDNRYYQDSLGWACYKLGQYDEAKQALTQAVSVPSPGPEEWIVFEHLAKVYEKLGDDKNARANYDRAQQLKPKP